MYTPIHIHLFSGYLPPADASHCRCQLPAQTLKLRNLKSSFKLRIFQQPGYQDQQHFCISAGTLDGIFYGKTYASTSEIPIMVPKMHWQVRYYWWYPNYWQIGGLTSEIPLMTPSGLTSEVPWWYPNALTGEVPLIAPPTTVATILLSEVCTLSEVP